MSNSYKIQVSFIENETGKVITNTIYSRVVPDLTDFEKLGFAEAFNELETAVIEASKEVNTEIVEKYLEETSKKKLMRLTANSTRKPRKGK
jgi:hypothetical protein